MTVGRADYNLPLLSPHAMTDDIPTLRRILAENKVIAMVGLSANWYRPSYFAAK